MSGTARIPKKVKDFVPYLDDLDDLQLSDGSTPPAKKWEDWSWSEEESEKITEYREAADVLFEKLSNKKFIYTEIRDEMKTLIKNVRSYDNDKLTGHHLLDKIALFGTMSDCETANVKRGTPLELSPSHKKGDKVTKVPVMEVVEYLPGRHKIKVTDPETPKSRAKPVGIKFVRVYRFIGSEEPTKFSQYTEIDNAENGYVISELPESETTGSTKVWAWYRSRYESNQGVEGTLTAPLKVGIIS